VAIATKEERLSIMSTSRDGIGQHRGDGQPAINSGQRTRFDPDAKVGQGSGGEEHSQDHGVPGSKADNITNTTHGAEESEFYSKNVRRK
jgi:hypothetical protein